MKYQIENSKDRGLENWRILVYGPPKTGKTFLGLTASKFYPTSLPAGEMTDLDDVIYLDFDDGLSGLSEQNLSVPRIDLSKLDGKGLVDALTEVPKAITPRIKEGQTKTVVIDTISTLNTMLVAHYKQAYPDPRHQGIMYNEILRSHLKFFNSIRMLPCNILVLSHAQFKVDFTGDGTMSKKKQAESMPGQSEVVPDITGRAGNFYRASTSIMMPMLKRRMGGKNDRALYPHGYGGFEAGSRFAVLEEKEEAHLGKLIAKIKGDK